MSYCKNFLVSFARSIKLIHRECLKSQESQTTFSIPQQNVKKLIKHTEEAQPRSYQIPFFLHFCSLFHLVKTSARWIIGLAFFLSLPKVCMKFFDISYRTLSPLTPMWTSTSEFDMTRKKYSISGTDFLQSLSLMGKICILQKFCNTRRAQGEGRKNLLMIS